jgi:hypothetical protein
MSRTRLSSWLRAGAAGLMLAVAGCSSSSRPEHAKQEEERAATAAPATPADRSPGNQPSAAQERDAERPAVPAARGEWDVDLRRDEQRGGHTIARHVGRTDAQLQARLERESIAAASTYADVETAEQVVARALAANARRVQRWIDQRSPKNNLAIRYRARDGLATGRLLRRGANESDDVTGAVVVLRWRDQDWYVLTTYPEKPR